MVELQYRSTIVRHSGSMFLGMSTVSTWKYDMGNCDAIASSAEVYGSSYERRICSNRKSQKFLNNCLRSDCSFESFLPQRVTVINSRNPIKLIVNWKTVVPGYAATPEVSLARIVVSSVRSMMSFTSPLAVMSLCLLVVHSPDLGLYSRRYKDWALASS
jgi:hypothetical protein